MQKLTIFTKIISLLEDNEINFKTTLKLYTLFLKTLASLQLIKILFINERGHKQHSLSCSPELVRVVNSACKAQPKQQRES